MFHPEILGTRHFFIAWHGIVFLTSIYKQFFKRITPCQSYVYSCLYQTLLWITSTLHSTPREDFLKRVRADARPPFSSQSYEKGMKAKKAYLLDSDNCRLWPSCFNYHVYYTTLYKNLLYWQKFLGCFLVSPKGNVNGRITIEPASTVAPGTNVTIVCTGTDAEPTNDDEPSQFKISTILILEGSESQLKLCKISGADKRECTLSRPSAQKSDALNYSCVFDADLSRCEISQALTVTDNGKRHNRIIIHYFVFVVCLLQWNPAVRPPR